MYPLLILREEMVCLIILVFLLINGRFYKMGKDDASFLRMCLYALGHVVFDIITVLTVNHVDTVPPWLNFAVHVVFYLFAILFADEFFCYTVALCLPKRALKKIRICSLIPLALYLILLPALPIVYLEGNGTNYSFGMAVYVGYALAMVFFIASAVLITLNYRKMAPHVRMALIPMLAVMVVAECVQIAVPELLFTGSAVTIVTVGFFFSLENPADVFRQKVLIDALTGVKSRHSYEIDIQRMEREYAQDPGARYGMVFCDINGLKAVNDNYGHLEGDAYIGQIAQILLKNLRGAESIYRMGGDEFMAAYRGADEAVIRHEIDMAHQDCEAASRERPYPVSLAIGYAVSGPQYASLKDVLRVADYMMYKHKAEMKKQVAFISNDGQKLNISGLTDRIFDAFADMGDRSYLSLCNMTTNVSRWSRSAVDYFGLPGEFIFDCASVWMEYIHPDDRADYRADISEVFAGNRKYHNVEYRVRNKRGEYVICTCRGRMLKGKNGEPDMFAATLFNHGIAESIDPVTGLHNGQLLIQHLEKLIREGAGAALLKLSIFDFGRVNLLYGYANGNEILRRFADVVKRRLQGKGRVFRMEGTKFVLCLPGASAEEIAALYRDLQDAARREIRLNGLVIPLRLAGGAYMMEERFAGDNAIVRNNLTYAHARSRHDCHGRLIFYGDPVPDDVGGDYRLLTRIHQDAVMDQRGFYLEYQPIVRMDSGEIIGAEALLRWRSDDSGEVMPLQFVPWLENDPCFYQLGKWVLQRALLDARKMLSVAPEFAINVNVTAFQLEDERFNAMVLDALRESGFPPRQLCLELTERCRGLDLDYLRSEISFFHNHGIRVALDDVGTGFSSVGLLLQIPVDEIKLDKSYIADIHARRANQIFVRAIVEAAQSLDCRSCFEGVEDEATYQYLRQYGAMSYQGYYFSKPVPVEALGKMLAQRA